MPRSSVFACFLCPGTDEILLVHQRGGKWSLPGGRRFAREPVMPALRRELQEETRYTLPAGARPTGAWWIRRPWRGRGRDALVFFFRGRPDVTAGAEIDQVGWFSLDALPETSTRTVLAARERCLSTRMLAMAPVA